MGSRDGTSPFARFSRGVDRLVLFLEKERLSLLSIFIYILLLSLARDFSEYYLLDRSFVIDPHPWIYSIAHHIAFYFVNFLGLVLLLSAFTKRSTRKVLNYVCFFYWVIVLPPYIDHFFFGSNQNYSYFSATDFLNALLHFSGATFHPGQGLEVILILFAVLSYGIWTQRERLRTAEDRALTAVRVGMLIFFTFLSMFIMATPGSYLPVGSEGGVPSFPFFESTKYYQYHLFIFAYYLLLGMVLSFAIIYISKKSIFRRLVSSMRPAQTIFFLGIVAAGTVTGWSDTGGMSYVTSILDTPYWVNIAFVIMVLVSAFLAWQVSTIWNDIADRHSDSPDKKGRVIASGLIDVKTVRDGSIVMAVTAMAIAFLLSLEQAAILALIIALSYAYSLKPFRLKEHMFSPLFIGIGALLTFLFGAFTPFSYVGYIAVDNLHYLTGQVIVPSISTDALFMGFYIFLGLVVGSMVTDIDGFDEDREGAVRTVYTQWGKKRGAMIVGTFVLFASLTPLILFGGIADIVLFPILGVAAAYAFIKWNASKPVLAIAMIGFVYAALRYLGVI